MVTRLISSGVRLTKLLKLSFLFIFLGATFSANATYPFVFGGVNDLDPTAGVSIHSNSDNPETMTVGGNGFLYVGGDFAGENINFSANFDIATSLVTSSLNLFGNLFTTDGFIAAYNRNTDLQWVVALQGIYNNRVKAVASDNTGNVYVTGYFSSTDVNGTPENMIVNHISTAGVVTPLGNYGTADDKRKAFIMKLSPAGALLWFKVLDGNALDSDSKGQTIAVDSNNSVYVGGEFTDDIDFDPNAGNTVINSNDGETDDSSDAFVMKLTSNGDLVWVKTIGGENDDEEVGKIVVDSANDVLYIGGSLSSDNDGINMNGDVNTLEFISTNAANLPDGSGTRNGYDFSFVQKLNTTNGNMIWSKAFLADVDDQRSDNSISSIAVNLADGSVFVAGDFDDTIDFNPDPAIANKSQSTGDNDMFFVKLDTNGIYQWHGALGNRDNDTDEGIDAIHFGNNKLYISGDYSGLVQAGSGTAANIAVWANNIPASNGDQDALLLQLDASDGSFLWARNFGGTAYDTGDSFTQDALGNVYFAGQFKKTIDLDPSVDVLNKTTYDKQFALSSSGRDAFVVKLSESGGLITQNSQPPIAKAQALWNYVQQNQWSVIDGSASYDLNGETLTYSWRQVAGPRLTLLDSSESELTFIAPFVTSVVDVSIELVVSNGTYSSQPVMITFSVGPNASIIVDSVKPDSSSDGGSVNFIGLFLLMLIGVRRNLIASNRLR